MNAKRRGCSASRLPKRRCAHSIGSYDAVGAQFKEIFTIVLFTTG